VKNGRKPKKFESTTIPGDFQSKITRRKAISKAGAAALGAVVGAVVAGSGGYLAGLSQAGPGRVETRTVTQTVTQTVTGTVTQPPAGKIEVTWGIWSWGVELVQDNAAKFNAWNDDVYIKVVDYGLDTFFSGISAAYTAGNPPTIHYSTPDVTYIYQQNGWAIDMEQYFPEIRRYLDDIFPGFRSGFINPDTKLMSGLPYYGGAQPFMYNKRHLDAAGIGQPPKTWEELEEQARKIKQKGICDDPIGIWYGSWGFVEVGIYDFMLGMAEGDRRPIYVGRKPKPNLQR
jgi:ABC-type glycerol-3-phosphate transport system substrate-binding protein